MPHELAPFRSIPLDDELLQALIDEHEHVTLPRLRRLWNYYRNALAEPDDRGGSIGAPAQAVGLPARLIGPKRAAHDDRVQREIVIENDIAWRIHTLVDFMFPAPLRLVSAADDPARRSAIERILGAVIDANGGERLWQDAALAGAIHGHVDFLVRCGGAPGAAPSKPSSRDAIAAAAATAASIIIIETVEAPRAIPLLNEDDFRALDAYIVHYERESNEVDREGVLARLGRAILGRAPSSPRRATVTITEIHSARACQRYEDDRLVAESVNRLGRVPVVHVQNISQPLMYSGLSDVEPLIPLQDELNTRLSDRANRVTMQSFRMYLGKGIDGFVDRPVGPGQMWMTDNLDASIQTFGGDADSPSESAHIQELREAMDKASGVTPAAAGHIKAKIGNLTSENALRISLMGTLAKVKRKRLTYGAGIAQVCELVLHALDAHGVFATTPAERRVEVVWPDPLPIDESRRIADALAKAQLGVPTSVLRAELGYPDEAS